MEREQLEGIAKKTLDCAFTVHSELGPGLLEKAYEACLLLELHERGLKAITQKIVPVVYKGAKIDTGFKLDLLVEDELIVEIKAVEGLLPVHSAQLLSYLRLSEKRLGLLINFNVSRLKHGIRRVVNGL